MLKLEGGTFKHEDRRKVFFFEKLKIIFLDRALLVHLLSLAIMIKVRNVVQSSDCFKISILILCEMEMKIDFFTPDMPLLHFRA
jgi:hypothetical protein